MRVTILGTAEVDLEEGYRFYESQSDGLGTYFLDTLYLILIHSPFMQACIVWYQATIAYYQSVYHLQFITVLQMIQPACMPFWTVAGIQAGQEQYYPNDKLPSVM
jgi:hypothetical protein